MALKMNVLKYIDWCNMIKFKLKFKKELYSQIFTFNYILEMKI